MQPTIIGIHGKARSGKDTLANFILARYGGYLYSFADPIRAMLVPLGIDLHDPYWVTRKEDVIPALGVSPRRLLQTLGTEWGRDIVNKEIWITMAKRQFFKNGPGMIVPDVRLENEAAWVREQGGIVIHLDRAVCVPVESHSSEHGIEFQDGDFFMFNNGTFAELQQNACVVIDGLLKT